MTFIDAIVLGLVQGLTEFIPVSSSGHLVITNHLLSVGNAFTFDVLLNFGTLLALIIYYRKRIWSIIKRTLIGREWWLLAKIVLATIPAVIFGTIFDSQVKNLNDNVWVVALALFVLGVLMIVKGGAEPKADDRELETSISWSITVKIGITQAIALIPGVSRSGITIFTGLRNKLSAKKAAEFSFLLAIPILAGASFKTLLGSGGIDFVKNNMGQVLIGNAVAFVSGMLAISFFIKLLSSRGLKDFGWYRVTLAVVLISLAVTGVV